MGMDKTGSVLTDRRMRFSRGRTPSETYSMEFDIFRWWNRAAGGTVVYRQEVSLVYRIEKVATCILVATEPLLHSYVIISTY